MPTKSLLIDDVCDLNGLHFTWDLLDSPLSTKETNGALYVNYRALGFSKKDIKYTTEYINRTGMMEVKINGEYNNTRFGVKENLNIKYSVDPKIYDRFEVIVNHGFITLAFYEKKNEAPEFKDVTRKYVPRKDTKDEIKAD